MNPDYQIIERLAEGAAATIKEKVGGESYEPLADFGVFGHFGKGDLASVLRERIRLTCVKDQLWKNVVEIEQDVIWFEGAPFSRSRISLVNSYLSILEKAKQKFSPIVEGGEEFFDRLAKNLQIATANTQRVFDEILPEGGRCSCDPVVQGRKGILVASSTGYRDVLRFYEADLALLRISREDPRGVVESIQKLVEEKGEHAQFRKLREVLNPYGIWVEADGGGRNGKGWFKRPLVGIEISETKCHENNKEVKYKANVTSPCSYARTDKKAMRITPEQEEWLLVAIEKLQDHAPKDAVPHINRFQRGIL